MKVLRAVLLAAVTLQPACGDSPTEPFLPPDGFMALSAGADHTCALTSGGRGYCWGSDASSQLGDSVQASRMTPVRVQTPAVLAQISAGGRHTCALDREGLLLCWGGNQFGQLGNGTTVGLGVPTEVAPAQRWLDVSAGAQHTCAIDLAGQAWCWGSGGQGQLGTGTLANEMAPTPVAGGQLFVRIDAGDYHTCAIDGAAALWCWGQNHRGQLGDGSTISAVAPVRVESGGSWRSVSAGREHTCGVQSGGASYCWGGADHGELGTGGFGEPGVPGATAPALVTRDQGWVDVAAGDGFSCAVGSAGDGWCWGRGYEGQIGNGALLTRPNPQPVDDGDSSTGNPRFASVSAGRTHACGLTPHGAVYCWGTAMLGGLGNPGTLSTAVAVRVTSGS